MSAIRPSPINGTDGPQASPASRYVARLSSYVASAVAESPTATATSPRKNSVNPTSRVAPSSRQIARTLFEHVAGGAELPLLQGGDRLSGEHLHSHGRAVGAWPARQGSRRPLAHLCGLAAEEPEPEERRRQAAGELAFAGRRHAPAERGANVVVLAFEAAQPANLAGAHDLRVGSLGDLAEERRVLSPQALRLTRRIELFERELADRFEHEQTRLAVRSLHLAQQALTDQ